MILFLSHLALIKALFMGNVMLVVRLYSNGNIWLLLFFKIKNFFFRILKKIKL